MMLFGKNSLLNLDGKQRKMKIFHGNNLVKLGVIIIK